MSAPVHGATALRERLGAVVARLGEAAELLEANPFREAVPAWLDASPRLASELLAVDDATLDTLELDTPALTERLGRVDARYASLPALTSIGRWPDRPPAVPAAEPAHVPGRKWAQIRALLGVLAPDAAPAVDWCAGKGHLGRQLHLRAGAPVRCIEVDPDLCASGEALARTLPLVFERRDVTTDPPELHPEERIVALHACGHLHDLLIDRSASAGVRGLAFAPCCYHLGTDRGAPWQPAARSGPQTPLPDELVRFAVRETVTAPLRVRRRRRLERSYRLAFEALRRELDAQRPDYRPIPSVPGSLLSAGFPAFCAHAAAHLGLELPTELDAEHWLALGTQADARARRLELARAPFRRLLELRMALDRALALAEAGYAVGLGEFCERALTPRNLLIVAERPM